MELKDNTRKRIDSRNELMLDKFEGFLRIGSAGETIQIRPVDVSRRGLGFISSTSIEPGKRIWLCVGSTEVRVELAYCTTHLGIENLFRCGLFTWDPEFDLTQLFRERSLFTAEEITDDQ